MNKPWYRHDCDKCKFIAHFGDADGYFCPQDNEYVLRYSDNDEDYVARLERYITHFQPVTERDRMFTSLLQTKQAADPSTSLGAFLRVLIDKEHQS